MAKENEFVEGLQEQVADGVLDKRTDLKKQRDALVAAIAELESNAIKDPIAIKNLRKQLEEVEKKISQKKSQKEEIANEEKSVEGKSVKEIEEEGKAKQNEEKTGDEPDREDSSTEKAYEDAMQQLHDFRIRMYNNQMKDGQNIRLVSTREEFRQELELEKKKIALKTKYEAELGDKENALKEKEEKLASEERQAKEPILREIRERSRKYAEAMVELHKVNLELAYIHDLMQKDKISQEDYAARKEKALNEQTKLKDKIAKLNPDELMQAMEEEKLRKDERAKVLGKDFERQAYKNASFEEKRNLAYANSKKITQERNLEFAEKESILNTKTRIEEREEHIKRLKKELDELPDTDIERRYEILREMEVENLQLEHDQKQMDRIDRGETLSPEEEIKENVKIEQAVQEVEEQNKEDYAKTQEAIETIEKQEGEVALEQPEADREQEEKREEAMLAGAVVGATVLGDDGQTAAGAFVGATIAEGLTEDEPLAKNMPGLLAVNDPNTKDGAEAILAADAKIRAAQEELAKNEQAVKKEVGNV